MQMTKDLWPGWGLPNVHKEWECVIDIDHIFDITFSVSLHGGPLVSLHVGTICQSSSAWVIDSYTLMEFD